MLSIAAVLGFGLAVTPMVLTPGASFTLLVMRSAELYQVIHLVGAAYLVGLGAVLL